MATLNELLDIWSEDASIDKTSLDSEALKIAKLHHKYYKLYITEKLTHSKMLNEHRALYKTLHEYYSGKFTTADYSEYKYEMLNKTILKQDIQMHIEADSKFAESLIKLSVQEEKVDFLVDVIKSINNRNFAIKNATDFLRWTQGST